MNQLNVWLKLEQMDEENPRFETFMNLMNVEDREKVSLHAALCAYKIYPGGCAARFNKHILGTARKALDLLRFCGLNTDALRFDDYYFTELNCVFLYELNLFSFKTPVCPHCYHLLSYNFNSKISHCTKCDYVLPS